MRDRLGELVRLATSVADAVATRAAAPLRALIETKIPTPQRLRAAPPDLRTGDATVADEILSGYFSFDGKIASTRDGSPFDLDPPSHGWRRSLASFSWLRHLRAAQSREAAETARALVDDFAELEASGNDDPAQEPETVARRTLALLAHAPLMLSGADGDFHERFHGLLAREARSLARSVVWRRAQGADRLICALALLEFCLCAEVEAELKAQATALFVEELERQFVPSGGHVGRNPQLMVELLLDLLALRKLYALRGIKPPAGLAGAIDKTIPTLRLLQHGDGILAHFNGMGADRKSVV
jgi:uncharacterized heparinase superfamily protein